MADSGIRHVVSSVPVPRTEYEDQEHHALIHGNSFPAGPAERQLFYRDDEHKWYIYNGTAWTETTSQAPATLNDIGDVEVPTPADDDLFYYDDATSLWKSRKLVDADIPAGIARDTEVATAVSDHADLTTGVHGLGALHAAGFHSAGQVVSKVVWKDASETALTDSNRTSTLSWTDLDLTAYTSADAKLAILLMRLDIVSYTSGYVKLEVRKNGTTPNWRPCVYGLNLAECNKEWPLVSIIGLDSGQVIEYQITVSGTAEITSYIGVLGYIE